MTDKEAAYILIKNGMSQKEAARILRKSENTVSGWAKKGKWNDKIVEESLFRETSEEKVRKLINFQLKVIEMIADKHSTSLNDKLTVEELQKLLIGRGDIDALQKLFTTIKGKEMEWSQIVKVVRDLTEYVEAQDLELAKEITPLANEFLNEMRKNI